MHHFWFSGSGFGEPHYRTFDGYQRIGFYGNGYHTVLKIEQNHNFTLQSDLDKFVMRSLAFGVQGVESYQVLAILLFTLITSLHKLSVTCSACLHIAYSSQLYIAYSWIILRMLSEVINYYYSHDNYIWGYIYIMSQPRTQYFHSKYNMSVSKVMYQAYTSNHPYRSYSTAQQVWYGCIYILVCMLVYMHNKLGLSRLYSLCFTHFKQK